VWPAVGVEDGVVECAVCQVEPGGALVVQVGERAPAPDLSRRVAGAMLEQNNGRTSMQSAVAEINIGQDEQRQEQVRRNQAVIALLNAWEHEDPNEQRETIELLMRTLDVDRTSSRRIFP